MMEKNETNDLHIAWMDGYYCGARMRRSSIAQSIRDAAINWPAYLGDVEGEILNAFCSWSEWESVIFFGDYDEQLQSITFMLLVAEALE